MGAELVHQPETALGVAPRDEPLRQQLDPYRRALVLGQLRGEQRREPVAAEQLPIGVPGPVRVSSSFCSFFSMSGRPHQ